MSLKLKKSEPTLLRAISQFAVLDESGAEVAQVYQRESSKMAFKRGYCNGPVPTKGWFFRLSSNPTEEHGMSVRFGGGPKWSTRARAVRALAALLGGAS